MSLNALAQRGADAKLKHLTGSAVALPATVIQQMQAVIPATQSAAVIVSNMPAAVANAGVGGTSQGNVVAKSRLDNVIKDLAAYIPSEAVLVYSFAVSAAASAPRESLWAETDRWRILFTLFCPLVIYLLTVSKSKADNAARPWAITLITAWHMLAAAIAFYFWAEVVAKGAVNVDPTQAVWLALVSVMLGLIGSIVDN